MERDYVTLKGEKIKNECEKPMKIHAANNFEFENLQNWQLP